MGIAMAGILGLLLIGIVISVLIHVRCRRDINRLLEVLGLRRNEEKKIIKGEEEYYGCYLHSSMFKYKNPSYACHEENMELIFKLFSSLQDRYKLLLSYLNLEYISNQNLPAKIQKKRRVDEQI